MGTQVDSVLAAARLDIDGHVDRRDAWSDRVAERNWGATSDQVDFCYGEAPSIDYRHAIDTPVRDVNMLPVLSDRQPPGLRRQPRGVRTHRNRFTHDLEQARVDNRHRPIYLVGNVQASIFQAQRQTEGPAPHRDAPDQTVVCGIQHSDLPGSIQPYVKAAAVGSHSDAEWLATHDHFLDTKAHGVNYHDSTTAVLVGHIYPWCLGIHGYSARNGTHTARTYDGT